MKKSAGLYSPLEAYQIRLKDIMLRNETFLDRKKIFIKALFSLRNMIKLVIKEWYVVSQSYTLQLFYVTFSAYFKDRLVH